MRSFHQSRGKFLFEVLCSLVIAASCAGAWMQTGAWALLPVALVALLYGIVHAFELARRDPVSAADLERIDSARDQPSSLLDPLDSGLPPAEASQKITTNMTMEEVKLVELAAPRESKGRRAKAPRKGGHRASEPKESKVTERAPPEEAEVAVPVAIEKAEVVAPVPPEEAPHVPLAPLFEPEPFARQQRAMFGRKVG